LERHGGTVQKFIGRWPGWYRHITLALLAYAFLAVTCAQAAGYERAKGDTAA
jgi:hypothetical protein